MLIIGLAIIMEFLLLGVQVVIVALLLLIGEHRQEDLRLVEWLPRGLTAAIQVVLPEEVHPEEVLLLIPVLVVRE